MPKNTTIIFLLLLFYSQISQAQILKNIGNKLKDKANSTISNPDNDDVLIKAAIVALNKSYAKKDSTSMNLALSSYDNVAFYSDRKGAENALRYGSTLIGELGDYEFSREDEGKSTAELVGISNPFGRKNKDEPAVVNNSYKNLNDDQYQLLKQAEALNQTGELSYNSRFFEYAQTSFLGSSAIMVGDEMLEKSLLHAKVKSNLGMLSHSIGDFSSSESYFTEALDIMGRSGIQNNYLYAVIANNQAILLKDQGKFNKAENQFKGVIAVFENLGSDGIKASLIAKNNLAILYQYLGRTEESIKILEEITNNSTAWSEKSNSYQRVNINLALIYENVGNIEAAETIYLKSLTQKKKQRRTKQPDYASILTNLASLYLNNSQLDKDIAGLLEEATTIYTKQYGEEHPTLATVNEIKIAYYLNLKQYENAENTAQSNYQLTENIFGKDHPKQNKATIQLAVAEWKNNKSDDAKAHFIQALDKDIKYIQNYFPAMSEVEKGKFWQTLQSDFHTFYSFAFANQTKEVLEKVLEYELETKGLLLSTSGKIRKKILESGDQSLIENYNLWKSSKNQLAYFYSISKEELTKQNINLDSIVKFSNEKERWLSANTDLFESENNYNHDIGQSLANDESLIDLIKYYDTDQKIYFYDALIITNNNIKSARIGPAKELDTRSIKVYKNAIKYKKSESRSFDAFWKNIQSQLAGINKIYLVKDGVFNQISIGSLYDGNQYIADLYDITVLTNPKDLTSVKNNAGIAKNLFLMGSPAFDTDKYSPLPGTLVEINDIALIAAKKKLRTTKYLNHEASERNFAKATNASVLHVATHGFFLDKVQPNEKASGETVNNSSALDALMRSGIVLTELSGEGISKEFEQRNDGLLTAYEISTLDFPETELVVLSACETGLGEIKTGEGVYGLQRSFLVAGAKSVVMSLWKVDDNATQEFMVTFYRNWLNSGNKHEAFNNAKRQLKSKFEAPYYWGAFVLIEG